MSFICVFSSVLFQPLHMTAGAFEVDFKHDKAEAETTKLRHV